MNRNTISNKTIPQIFIKDLRPTRSFGQALLVALMLFMGACGGAHEPTTDAAKARNPAIAQLNERIAGDPDNAQLYYDRGKQFEALTEDSLALMDYKKASRIDSTQAAYFSAVGNLYFKHRDVSSSLPWFKKAIALDPQDQLAHLNFAKVLLFAKDYQQAFKEINMVLRKDVYNPEAYLLKGLIYKEMKDTSKAISSFQTALQVAPQFKDAMIQMAQIYRDRNDTLAFVYYENAFEADTKDVFPLYAIGMIYQERKDYEKAKATYARMLNYDIQNADAYFNTGYILMHQDSLDKAYRMFDHAIKVQPDYADAYYNRGLTSELMGDTSAAKKDYNQALNFDEQNQMAQQGLKRLQ